MKFFSKKRKEIMPKASEKAVGRRAYITAMTVALLISISFPVYAETDPVEMISNLSTVIFSIVKAIGGILVGFGVVQVGLALKSHDASQRANGFLTVAGGIVIYCSEYILSLITG